MPAARRLRPGAKSPRRAPSPWGSAPGPTSGSAPAPGPTPGSAPAPGAPAPGAPAPGAPGPLPARRPVAPGPPSGAAARAAGSPARGPSGSGQKPQKSAVPARFPARGPAVAGDTRTRPCFSQTFARISIRQKMAYLGGALFHVKQFGSGAPDGCPPFSLLNSKRKNSSSNSGLLNLNVRKNVKMTF